MADTAIRPTGASISAARALQMLAIPVGVVAVVVMLVIPLPSQLLDLLITINMSGSVLILLTALHVKRPLEFSVFPTLLLVMTVFRLALNVSATRLVLLHGYAGVVIQSFGHFVVGGSVIVGLVVFLILIIIQFVVITNGAGRVAEVAARFTLDAMPGKQMSVDADLSSGLINQDEARRRRAEVADEADFYGAMDGASKFVRGDAIAAIVIVAVNLIGGLAIGIVQRHLPVAQAGDTYSLLSVGDGLVSQIPALLLSLSTGIIVTRAAGEGDFALNVVGQLSRYRRVVQATAVVIFVLALIPGLPKIPFFIVSIGMFVLGSRLPRDLSEQEETPEPLPGIAPVPDTPAQLARETSIPELELELGMELIDLVDRARGGDLLDRVKALRRNIARELGIVIPPVHARDNDRLELAHYAIRVHGVQVAEGAAPKGKLLAVGPGLDQLEGDDTKDPAFGGPAKWIENHLRYRGSVAGATVVERSAVIATHLSEVVRQRAGELLSRQDVRVLLDALKNNHPVVLEEMATAGLTLGQLQGVLRRLLDESVPVRDLVRIIEAITDQAAVAKDGDSLLEAARVALGPLIAELHQKDGRIAAITLEPSLEQSLGANLQLGERGRVLGNPPEELEALIAALTQQVKQAEAQGKRPVVVCSTRIRPALRRLIRARLPRVDVLGAAEIASHVVIENIGVVHYAQAAAI